MENEMEYRIIQRVLGSDKVEDLRAKLDDAEKSLKVMIDLERAAGNVNVAATKTIQDQAAAVAKLQTELSGAQRELGKLGGSSANMGRGLLEGSRAIEDLQYGVGGVLNNIPGLIQALGGPAGLAGAVSLLAVGATQLYKHWDDLLGLFGQGHVKTQAEELDELAKKTKLAADEAERLNRANAIPKKVKEIQDAKPKAVRAVEGAVTEAIVEADPQTVIRAIKKDAPELIDSQGEAAVVRQEIEDKRSQVEDLKKQLPTDETGEIARQIGDLEKEIRDISEDTGGPTSKQAIARRNTAEDKAAQAALVKDWGTRPLEDLIRIVQKDLAGFGGGDVKKGEKLLRDLQDAQLAGTKDAGKKAAAPLQDRYNVARANGVEQTQASIEGELVRDGYSKEDAKRIAASTLKALQEGFVEEIKKRAGEKGLDTAGAAKSIVDDYAARMDAEKKKVQDKLDAEKKKGRDLDKFYEDMDDDNYKMALSEAKRTKSYLGKSDDQLSLAEKDAKKDADEAAAGKKKEKDEFNRRVEDARKSQDYRSKDEEDLTAEEKRAKQLDEKAEKAVRDSVKGRLDDTPGLGEGLQGELLRRQLGGMDPRRALMDVQTRLARQLESQGLSASDAAEEAHKRVGDANKTLMEDLMKPEQAKQSEVLDAGKSFAEKIQSSISSDPTQKNQLEVQKKILDAILHGKQVPAWQ